MAQQRRRQERAPAADASDWSIQIQRANSKLDAAGWRPGASAKDGAYRAQVEETAGGPSGYALWLDQSLVAVVRAKPKVMTNLPGRGGVAEGLRSPFSYVVEEDALWFHDSRHVLNRPRRVAAFHSPAALKDLLNRDLEAAHKRLLALPNDNEQLRPYQRDAHTAVGKALAARKREVLVAMAPGAGKTYALVNQVYRLIKSGVAQRVLVLVDRRALAVQALRAFSTFEVAKGRKFDRVYEVTSSRFRPWDFGPGEEFQPRVLSANAFTDPKPGHVFVHVCTIQRMAINVLGAQAVFAGGEEVVDEDLKRLEIPIHAFDAIVSDECHRGYTSSEVSVWRDTLDHFDAIKIGLTATPAAHTTSYFKSLVARYDYPQAVRDGFLVDYDAVAVPSEIRIKESFLKDSERVPVIDPITRLRRRDRLHDERDLETEALEARIVALEPGRSMVEALKKCALEHERTFGRFPKTLIFAANDLPDTSHADQIVRQCRDLFGRDEAFVQKITSRVERPLQRIQDFRDRPNPGIAVTVDLLINGIDLPDLEFVALLRPVKSRILFEQMLGRGTRRSERYPDKSHFTVFDGFGGDLLRYFKESTGITAESPDNRPIASIIEDIWADRDRANSLGSLMKRLLRIDKQMAFEARDKFARYIPKGDVFKYAQGLPAALKADFVGTMKLLRNPLFRDLLVTYPRPPRKQVADPVAPRPTRPAQPEAAQPAVQTRPVIAPRPAAPIPPSVAPPKPIPARPPPVESRKSESSARPEPVEGPEKTSRIVHGSADVAGPKSAPPTRPIPVEPRKNQIPARPEPVEARPEPRPSPDRDGGRREPEKNARIAYVGAEDDPFGSLEELPMPVRPPPPSRPRPREPLATQALQRPRPTAWPGAGRVESDGKPESTLAVFEKFVRENPEHIQAIGILLARPKEWGPGPLIELKTKLNATQQFTIETLQKAHKETYRRNRVDLISMVKHAADEKEPLLTASERVERALKRVAAGHTFTPDQEKWLESLRDHLRDNLSIAEYDFDNVPVFARQGGRAMVRKLFKHRLPELLHDLNEALVV